MGKDLAVWSPLGFWMSSTAEDCETREYESPGDKKADDDFAYDIEDLAAKYSAVEEHEAQFDQAESRSLDVIVGKSELSI